MEPVLLDSGIRAAQQNELSKARTSPAYCSALSNPVVPPWAQPDAPIDSALPSAILYREPTRQAAVPAPDLIQQIRWLISGARATLIWTVFGLALVLFLAVAAAMTPMFFGNRTLVVLSGSMQPVIPEGAAVVVQPYPSKDLQVGDVIAFNSNADAAMPTVHRIVSIREKNGARFYTTRGDANETADVTEVSLPAMAWRVWYNLPLVGYIINAATRPIGIVLLIVIPVLLLLATSVFDRVKRTRPALSY